MGQGRQKPENILHDVIAAARTGDYGKAASDLNRHHPAADRTLAVKFHPRDCQKSLTLCRPPGHAADRRLGCIRRCPRYEFIAVEISCS